MPSIQTRNPPTAWQKREADIRRGLNFYHLEAHRPLSEAVQIYADKQLFRASINYSLQLIVINQN